MKAGPRLAVLLRSWDKVALVAIVVWLIILTFALFFGRNQLLPLPFQPSTPSADIVVLKTQIEMIRDYNEAFLSTVYWSLGTLVTVAALLTTFSWFTNSRIADQERTALRDEIQASIKSESLKLNDDIQQKTEKLENDLKQAADMPAIREANNVRRLALSVQTDVQTLRCDVLRIQAERWEERKVHTNAIRTYQRLAETARQIDDDYDLDHALAKIEGLLSREPLTDVTDIAELTEFLGSLPETHHIIAERIRSLLRQRTR